MVLLKLSMRQIQRSLESDDLIKCSYRELNRNKTEELMRLNKRRAKGEMLHYQNI